MKNRWMIAACAVGIHISIGSVYAWSVMKGPLQALTGWSLSQITVTFSVAIFFLGLSAALMGHFVEKRGPRWAGSVAAVFFGAGLVTAGLAVTFKHLWLLWVGYGAIGGIGLGIGYIAPVSTLVKWFPDRRGLATGLAIMGFGFASLIAGRVMHLINTTLGPAETFYILGGAYFVLMFASSQYLAPPPEGWLPAGFEAKLNARGKAPRADLSQLRANEAVRTVRFVFLWLMLFINVTCGIAVISVASPMGQEIAGMTPAAAATMVALMGLFNGGGRIAWASFSDVIGRPMTYTLFFTLQIGAFLFLPISAEAWLLQALIFLIMTCYGGGFSCIPAYIGDLFGTKQLAAIHGYVLTAWAAAGLVGPMLAAFVRETTQSYTATLYIFSGFFGAALVVSLLTMAVIRRIRRANGDLAAATAEADIAEEISVAE